MRLSFQSVRPRCCIDNSRVAPWGERTGPATTFVKVVVNVGRGARVDDDLSEGIYAGTFA
jgi:hypothetical protein